MERWKFDVGASRNDGRGNRRQEGLKSRRWPLFISSSLSLAYAADARVMQPIEKKMRGGSIWRRERGVGHFCSIAGRESRPVGEAGKILANGARSSRPALKWRRLAH